MYVKDPLVKAVSDCCWRIWKSTGPGFLEDFYKQALQIELGKAEIVCRREVPITVCYEDIPLSQKFLDLVVGEQLIVEAKATKRLAPVDYAQLRNYLKATNQPYGVLVNFGSAPMQFTVVQRDYKKPQVF